MIARRLSSRYRLEAEIGRGGMSSVWEATDELLGRKVAVKIFALDEASTPGVTARFRREAQIAASINHPNIVTVFDTGVDGAIGFLVMELLAGPTLAHKLAESGPLPVGEVLAIAAQVSAALAAAHAAGVVHRDIKPSNIAYASDGRVKVLDFGIARLLEATTGQTELTRTSTVIGTAAYLSPEQARGDPVSARTDLYAFGCVLFALLAGDPPFHGDTAIAVCSQHLHVEAPRLADLSPSVPPALAVLVAELLRKDPAARPPDAEALRRRIAAIRDVSLPGDPTIPLGAPQAPTIPLGPPEDLSSTSVYPSSIAAPRLPTARRGIRALLAGVILVGAVVLLIALFSGGSPPQRHVTGTTPPTSRVTSTTTSTTTSSTTTSSTTTTSTTTTSTTTTIPRATTPAQAIAQLRAAIAKAESSGNLAAPAGSDLLNRLSGLSRVLAKGNTKDAGEKVADLVSQIGRLAQSGQLTPAGQAILAVPLSDLVRLVPPQTGKGGPPPGPGGSKATKQSKLRSAAG